MRYPYCSICDQPMSSHLDELVYQRCVIMSLGGDTEVEQYLRELKMAQRLEREGYVVDWIGTASVQTSL